MKLLKLWLPIVLCNIYWVTAQDCTLELKGTVLDYHDATPLAQSYIYIEPLNKTIVTGLKGDFTIDGLCAGLYTLTVSHLGCETKTVTLDMRSSQEIKILLEHHIDELELVNVITDVHDNHENSQSVTRVKSNVLQDYSGATLGDALTEVTGVTVLKTGNSVVKPIVHGLHSSRVTIVNDGVRQQDQEWGVEHAPNIDINSVDNIQAVKGAGALRYGGDAIGGTIVISSQRYIAKDTLKGRIILQGQSNGRGGTLTSSANNYRASGWYQQATLTYKRLGDYESPDYILSNTGSQTAAASLNVGFKKFEYGASAKYSFYDTSIGILRASHTGNVSDLVRSINSGEPSVINDFTYDINVPRQEVQHHVLKLNGFRRFSNFGKLEIDYSYQFNNRKEYDIRRGNRAGQASLDIDLQTHVFSSFLSLDHIENLTIEAGIDGIYQLNKPNPDTGVRRLIPDYESYRLGTFAGIVYNPSEHWIFDAGIRYDLYHIDAQKYYLESRWEDLGYDVQFPQYEVREDGNQIFTNPVLDFNLWAATAGVKHVFDNHYDLSFNLSMANRAPNPSELFSDGLHHALATIELGKLDLEKEQSYQINSNFHINRNYLDIEVNPYLNYINNFIQLVPVGIETTTRGAFPVYQYEQNNSLLYGLDLSVNYDMWCKKAVPQPETGSEITYDVKKTASINSSFSYVRGQNQENDEPLIDMPPAQWRTTVTGYDIFIENLDFSISNLTMLQQNRFPDNDYTVDILQDNGDRITENVRISQTPSAYTLWNVGTSYTFNKCMLNLTVNNLFNTSYRDYLNRQRFYADEVGRDIQLQFIYNF